MKLVTAVIRPESLESVIDALHAAGVSGLTLTEAAGYGRQGGHHEVYRGVEYHIDSIAKVRLEIVVTDAREDHVMHTIVEAARTGNYGDGKVWSTTVEKVIRVRTSESGEDALR